MPDDTVPTDPNFIPKFVEDNPISSYNQASSSTSRRKEAQYQYERG